jgi:hypothetical protein
MAIIRVFILVILMPVLGGAQTGGGEADNSKSVPSLILHWQPSYLVSPYMPAVQFSLEHRFADRLYGHYQAGYLFNGGWAAAPTRLSASGFRVQAGVRRYLQEFVRGQESSFVEFQFMYRQYDAVIAGDFCRFGCAFRQRINYEMSRTAVGPFIFVGKNFGGPKVPLTFGCGFGLQHVRIKFSDVPGDAVFRTNGALLWPYGDDEKKIVPGFHMLLNIGFFLH